MRTERCRHRAGQFRRPSRDLNSDRRLRVYTLAEIGRLLSNFPAIAAIKDEFPGASVERVNEPRDPLDGIDRTYGDLDDEVPAF